MTSKARFLPLFFSLLFLSLNPFLLEASQRVELDQLDLLIEITEGNLKGLRELRPLIEDYLSAKKNFAEKEDSQAAAAATISSAKVVWSRIDEGELTHLFQPDFLAELKVFARVAR